MRIRCLIAALLAFITLVAFSISHRAGMHSMMEADAGMPVFVIDPGHGGEDGGAVSQDGLRESEVNLAVSLRLDAMLGLWGCPCILTRSSESLEYPPEATTVRRRKQTDLERRVDLANSTENAVLLSIHQNKYPTSGPRGAQVFYRDEPQSLRFAEYTQEILAIGIKGNLRPAAIIAESIYLMRMVHCPAILVECGFLSNGEELRLLRSEEYQTRLAICLACACAEYTKDWEIKNGKGSEG